MGNWWPVQVEGLHATWNKVCYLRGMEGTP